jgi:UDP-glucuronate decarboxylase
MYGNGEQTRAFCYVSDLIDGILNLMDTGDDFTGPVNIGNPQEMTVLDIARRIIGITGSRSQILFKPPASDDPAQRCPDITLARERLDWAPVISLDEGLRRTAAYFRQRWVARPSQASVNAEEAPLMPPLVARAQETRGRLPGHQARNG